MHRFSTTNGWVAFLLIAVTIGVTLISCSPKTDNRTRQDLGVEPMPNPLAKSAAFRDTIGSHATFEGLGPMRVRGFGVVVGLGKNGSSDCPKPIYDRLVQTIYKQHRKVSQRVGERTVTPERMINDLDTAVVIVEGSIPPAAKAGTTFDVAVMALPGTQTKSLRGGRLYTADLEVFRQTTSGPIYGEALARAAGPVFLNPFSDGDSATQSNPLEGVIIGGGLVTKDRRVRLVLNQPSYGMAQRIQERINAHFPARERVADALSPSFVQVTIPPEYQDETAHFLGLIRGLYLSRDPAFEQRRARELADEIVEANAPYGLISLCFEGLGRNALPVLGDLYAQRHDAVSFHAAIAGVRLGDYIAVDALSLHALDPTCAYRQQAIAGLREARGMAAAATALRKLLDDEDPRIRVAAYEALVHRGDTMVTVDWLGGDNFALDLVPSSRPNLIHVKRSGTRRIALIGQDFRCDPPLLYRAPDGSVTIDAGEDESSLRVLRMVTSTGAMSPEVSVPLELPAVIRLLGDDPDVDDEDRITGVGLDYAAVVRALYYLCDTRAINATFMLESPTIDDVLTSPKQEGRPESEL